MRSFYSVAENAAIAKIMEGAVPLTDFLRLKQRVEAGEVRDIILEMDQLLNQIPHKDVAIPSPLVPLYKWWRTFYHRSKVWERYPEAFHQDCINDPNNVVNAMAIVHPCPKPWIRWVNRDDFSSPDTDLNWSALKEDPEYECLDHETHLQLVDQETKVVLFRFASCGNRFVVGYSDGSFVVYNSADLSLPKRFKHSYGFPTEAIFCSSGRSLFTFNKHETCTFMDVCRWRLDDGHCTIDEGPTGTDIVIPNLASEECLTILSDSGENSLHPNLGCLLPIKSIFEKRASLQFLDEISEQVVELESDDNDAYVESADFTPCGCRIVALCSDRKVRIWDTLTGSESYSMTHPDTAITVKFIGPGGDFITGSKCGMLRRWNVRTSRPLAQLSMDAIESVEIQTDRQHVLVRTVSGEYLVDTIRMKDVSDSNPQHCCPERPVLYRHDAGFFIRDNMAGLSPNLHEHFEMGPFFLPHSPYDFVVFCSDGRPRMYRIEGG